MSVPTVPGSEQEISTISRAVPLDASRLMGRQRGMQAVAAGVSIRIDERLSVVLERGFDGETLKAALACVCAGARG